ncbi:hypothetical protein GFS60_06499 (plasmid) [Rhodococcus sp. WAY2]|nr:hypothetical protein GFS60_06499 [Rhodococcus sp. WAY2]
MMSAWVVLVVIGVVSSALFVAVAASAVITGLLQLLKAVTRTH